MLHRFWRSRSGSSAVEFALILPLFMLFVWGMVRLGLLLLSYAAMQNIARDATRSLAVGRNPAAVELNTVTQIARWNGAEASHVLTGQQARTTITVPGTSAAGARSVNAGIWTIVLPEQLSVTVVMQREA